MRPGLPKARVEVKEGCSFLITSDTSTVQLEKSCALGVMGCGAKPHIRGTLYEDEACKSAVDAWYDRGRTSWKTNVQNDGYPHLKIIGIPCLFFAIPYLLHLGWHKFGHRVARSVSSKNVLSRETELLKKGHSETEIVHLCRSMCQGAEQNKRYHVAGLSPPAKCTPNTGT